MAQEAGYRERREEMIASGDDYEESKKWKEGNTMLLVHICLASVEIEDMRSRIEIVSREMRGNVEERHKRWRKQIKEGRGMCRRR